MLYENFQVSFVFDFYIKYLAIKKMEIDEQNSEKAKFGISTASKQRKRLHLIYGKIGIIKYI